MNMNIYTITQQERDQALKEHAALIRIKVWADHNSKTTARRALMKLSLILKETKEVLP